eukprot:1162142-Pelagomonas_calceolata.AAC.23
MRENHLEADFARPGHHVAACLVSVPGLHRMPTWAKTREAMFEMCEDHPMEQCDDCTESSCPDPLASLSGACKDMPDMSQCTMYDRWCQNEEWKVSIQVCDWVIGVILVRPSLCCMGAVWGSVEVLYGLFVKVLTTCSALCMTGGSSCVLVGGGGGSNFREKKTYHKPKECDVDGERLPACCLMLGVTGGARCIPMRLMLNHLTEAVEVVDGEGTPHLQCQTLFRQVVSGGITCVLVTLLCSQSRQMTMVSCPTTAKRVGAAALEVRELCLVQVLSIFLGVIFGGACARTYIYTHSRTHARSHTRSTSLHHRAISQQDATLMRVSETVLWPEWVPRTNGGCFGSLCCNASYAWMAEKDCLKNDSRLGVVGQNTRAPQPSSHGHSSNMRRAQTELASPSHVCRPAVNVSGESWLHL